MTVRVGMIGAGRMANVHANCMADIPEARIVAVADILPERAQALSERTGATAYTDYRKMLDREQLDAVYVATPTGLHAEHAIAAAERQLPFFVEKPLALKMSDGWNVQRAAERNGVMSFVGYQWRYTEAVARAKEILGDRPLSVTACEWLWTIPPVAWFRIKEQGGGQVVDQSTHLTDLCQLFGGPVREVYAAYTLNTYTDAEFHNWDGYSLTWKHKPGAVGSLHCTYALFKEIAGHAEPYVQLMARELYLRITSKGLTVITPEGKHEYANSKPVLHFNMNQAFITAVDRHAPALIRSSVAETLPSLALTLAANASAETGQIVNLDQFMEAAR